MIVKKGRELIFNGLKNKTFHAWLCNDNDQDHVEPDDEFDMSKIGDYIGYVLEMPSEQPTDEALSKMGSEEGVIFFNDDTLVATVYLRGKCTDEGVSKRITNIKITYLGDGGDEDYILFSKESVQPFYIEGENKSNINIDLDIQI